MQHMNKHGNYWILYCIYSTSKCSHYILYDFMALLNRWLSPAVMRKLQSILILRG
jgi:hypothetical protein